MKKVCYVCSLHGYSSEGYFGEQFDTFEEAKRKGLETIEDYNRNLGKSYYDSENEVFATELEDIVDNEDKLPRTKITHFYVAELEESELPNNFGERIMSSISGGCYGYTGNSIQLTDDEKEDDITVKEALTKGLDKVINGYLGEKFAGCTFVDLTDIRRIEVE